MMECCVCHATPSQIKRCSRCHISLYCSTLCQRRDWATHRHSCIDVASNTTDIRKLTLKHKIKYYDQNGTVKEEPSDTNIEDGDTNVNLSYRGKRAVIKISKKWEGQVIMKVISWNAKVAITDMKVIIKGKVMTADTIADYIYPKTVIMVIGEEVLSSEGIEERDIVCLMNQMDISRRQAIQSLKNSTSLIDTILEIGNS